MKLCAIHSSITWGTGTLRALLRTRYSIPPITERSTPVFQKKAVRGWRIIWQPVRKAARTHTRYFEPTSMSSGAITSRAAVTRPWSTI